MRLRQPTVRLVTHPARHESITDGLGAPNGGNEKRDSKSQEGMIGTTGLPSLENLDGTHGDERDQPNRQRDRKGYHVGVDTKA